MTPVLLHQVFKIIPAELAVDISDEAYACL